MQSIAAAAAAVTVAAAAAAAANPSLAGLLGGRPTVPSQHGRCCVPPGGSSSVRRAAGAGQASGLRLHHLLGVLAVCWRVVGGVLEGCWRCVGGVLAVCCPFQPPEAPSGFKPYAVRTTCVPPEAAAASGVLQGLDKPVGCGCTIC
jgi:hypothetical protein